MGGYSNVFAELYGLQGQGQQQAQDPWGMWQAQQGEAYQRWTVSVRAEQAQAKQKEQEELESTAVINTFLVGCDPEFVGIDNGELVPMNRYFPQRGEIGYDHGGSVGELRPRPAKGTWTLIKRIKERIADLKPIPGIVRAGALVKTKGRERGYVTLGGHVHLDICPYDGVLGRNEGQVDPNIGRVLTYNAFHAANMGAMYHAEWVNPMEYVANMGRREVRVTGRHQGARVMSPVHNDRVGALDTLTQLLEHLDILPKGECEERRKGGLYGKYGDVRIQEEKRTEYRTMASWLFDPAVAFLCLTGAKIAAFDPKGTLESLKGARSFTRLTEWLTPFASKDIDVGRLCERFLPSGHKGLIVDPSGDFRERWVAA